MSTFSKGLKKKALKAGKKGSAVKITQSGARESSLTELTTGDIIPKEFLQKSYPTDNNCVWLSAALVINTIDPHDAQKMLLLLNRSPRSYEWLPIFRRKDGESLASLIGTRDVDIGYIVSKVSIQRDKLVEYILHECQCGIFVCVLKTTDGECSHAIGLDMLNRKIYDCMEITELILLEENLS